MIHLLRKAVRWLIYSITTFILLAATAVSVTQLLTPYLNEHKADFEKWVSELLNVPISIQGVNISWQRGEPEITFQQLAVLDKKTHRPTFEIQKLKINLQIIQSVLQRMPVPESIRIFGAHLIIQQKKSGQIQVQGLDQFVFTDKLTGAAIAGNALSAWIFTQPNLALRDIDIQFIPETGSRRSLTITHLDLHNTKSKHELEGMAALNQAIPTQAIIRLQWEGDALDMMQNGSHANLFLYLESIDLPQWINQQSWQHLQIKQGVGSGKFWFTWEQGQLQKVQSQFQLYALQLQSLITKKSAIISRINGHVSWERDGERQVITGEDILIDFPQHLWPTTQFTLTVLPKKTALHTPLRNQADAYSLQINYLDVADSAELALASGLLSQPVQNTLLSLAPRGELRSLHIQSDNSTEPEMKAYSAEFTGLSLKEWQAYPGVMNLNGAVSWDGKLGKLGIDSQEAALTLNSIFLKPLRFDKAAVNVQWQKTADGAWSINANNCSVSNADLVLNADVMLVVPSANLSKKKKLSPYLRMMGQFSVPQLIHIENYLPVKLFEPPFVTWLKGRFQGGQIATGKVFVQGNLTDFPFDNNRGKFLITAMVKDMEFEYAPGWPGIHHLFGDLILSGHSLTADMQAGQILNVPIAKAHGYIPYLGPAHPQILSLQAAINTDIAQGLRFIQQSPLRETIGKDLEGMQISGAMGLNLALIIPVKTPAKTQAKGDVQVSSVQLQLPAWHLVLNNLAGTLHFTEQTIQAMQLKGRLFDQDINLNIDTVRIPKAPPVVKASLKGKIGIPALQNFLNRPITHFLRGITSYTAELDVVPHQYSQPSQLVISSNLKGLEINLPGNYAKKANESRQFNLVTSLQQGQALQAKISYGQLATAVFAYEKPTQSWLAKINSADATGQIWLPAKSSGDMIKANFSYLHLTPDSNTPALDLNTIPAFSFIGKNVNYGDHYLGDISLSVVPTKAGLAIQNLVITSRDYNLKAEGEWLSTKGKYQTDLQGKLVTKNLSQLLEQWGVGSANLIAGDANFTFDLSWSNAPYKPELNSMSGDIAIQLAKGRIINLGTSTDAKVGFGRMLNVLSLQTLPRRLSLDFSDLFEKGYSFDKMQGHFNLMQGNAHTKDAFFDGPIARIEIKGKVGLVAKDVDLLLSVTPYVTGSIPVVATLAGGPVVGAVSWLVEKAASSAVSKVTTYHYSVKGSWDDPTWDKPHN